MLFKTTFMMAMAFDAYTYAETCFCPAEVMYCSDATIATRNVNESTCDCYICPTTQVLCGASDLLNDEICAYSDAPLVVRG